MKPKETLSNIRQTDTVMQELGDEHIAGSSETPLRQDAFELSDQQKITRIARHFREIMETLGLDLTDDSLQGTPKRVAQDVCAGNIQRIKSRE